MPVVDTEQTERMKDIFVAALFVIWIILLIPWIIFAGLSGMAVDRGYTVSAFIFIVSTWSYGLAVFGAFKLLDRSRKAVLLPFVSIVGILLSGLIDSLNRH